MNKTRCVLLALLCTVTLAAQSKKSKRKGKRKAKIEKKQVKVAVQKDTLLKPSTVNIYRNGAQIKLYTYLNLKKGLQTVKIYGLNSDINTEQLFPNHSNQYAIQRLEYLTTGAIKPNKQKLALENLRNKLEAQEKYQQILDRVALSNVSNWSIKENKSFPQEYAKVRATIASIKSQIKQKTFLSVNAEKSDNAATNLVVSVKLNAVKSGEVKFEMTYVDQQSKWEPSVQIFVDEKTNTTTLLQQALFYQQSSFDWNKVKLTIIDGTMQNSLYQPKLSPWTIDFSNYDEPTYRQHSRGLMKKTLAMMSDIVDEVTPASESHLPSHTFSYFTLRHSPSPVHIPYETTVVPSRIAYTSSPQLDQRVLVVAELLSARTPLIAGHAKVFLNAKLIRDSYINFGTSRDHTKQYLPLALDYDPKIMVSYEEIPSMRQESFLSSNKSTTYEYQLAVSSYYKVPKDVDIHLNIPVSVDEKIEVEFIPALDMEYDKKKGLIDYKLKLRPEGNQIKKIKYRISSPKDKPLQSKGI